MKFSPNIFDDLRLIIHNKLSPVFLPFIAFAKGDSAEITNIFLD
jgi:hypothetical protein